MWTFCMKDTEVSSKMLSVLLRSWKNISSYSVLYGSWGYSVFYKIVRYLAGLIWSGVLGHWSQHGIFCLAEIIFIPVNKNQAPFGFITCSCQAVKVGFDLFPVYMWYLCFVCLLLIKILVMEEFAPKEEKIIEGFMICYGMMNKPWRKSQKQHNI